MSYEDDIVSTIRIKASDETGEVMRGMSKKIEETTRAFEKLAGGFAGGEVLRRSFEGYAELTRNLEKLRFSADLTKKDMDSLHKTFDEASKITGQSTDKITDSFQKFIAMSGQQFGPGLEKMFKTIAEASSFTTVSIDQLSRIAASAMNNLKVPQAQMDELIKKWAVELPASLEAFSSVAPRVTESLNNLGFSGAKNAEEVALVFNTLNRGLGNTRLSAEAMNQIIDGMTNGSTQLGRMMIPTLLEVKKHGGSVVETFEKLYKTIESLHGFDKDVPLAFLEQKGLSLDLLRDIKTYHDGLNGITKALSESEQAAKKFHDEVERVSKDPLSAINQLSAGFENAKNSIGELMVAVGANENLKAFADQLSSVARLLNDISKGEWRKALQEIGRPVNGPIPGEEEEHHEGSGEHETHGSGGGFKNAPSFGALRYLFRHNSNLFSGSGVPKMARGGIVTSPTIAEIGEGGVPEAVIPLNNLGGGSGASGTRDNTDATKDNTSAVNRLSSYIRSSGRNGIYANAAFTPGAGDGITPAEAGLYGSGGGGSAGLPGANGGGPSGSAYEKWQRAYNNSSYGHRGGGARFNRSSDQGIGGGTGNQDYDVPAAASTDYGPGNNALSDQRSELMNEVNKDPATRHLMHQMLATEGGGARTLEALFNRTSMIRQKSPGYSIKDELHSGFYGPINRGAAQRTGISSKSAAEYNRDIERVVRGGSNLIEGRTDQGTYGDPNAGGPGRIPVPGHSSEIYNFWKGSRHGHQFNYNDTAAWARHTNELAGSPSASAKAAASGPRSSVGSNDRDPTGAGASFEHYQQMREHLERPIKMQIEAPTPPPTHSIRQRLARQQQRYQANDQIQTPRYASQMDIGFA